MSRARWAVLLFLPAVAAGLALRPGPDDPGVQVAAGRPRGSGPSPTTSTVEGPRNSTTSTVPAPSTSASPKRTTTTAVPAPVTTSSTTPVADACPLVTGSEAVAADGAGTGWIVGSSTSGFPAAAVTSDDGRTWTGVCLPVPAASGRLNDVFSLDGRHVWAVGSAADGALALRSGDGGRSWERAVVPATVSRLEGVTFVDPDHGWSVGAGGTEGGQVVASADGGRTWVLQSLPSGSVDLKGVAFADRQRGWAVGADLSGARPPLFLATDDGGSTWVPRPAPPGAGNLLDVKVVGDGRIVVVGHATLPPGVNLRGLTAVSDDGGSTWGAVTEIPDIYFWHAAVFGPRVWALGQEFRDGTYGGGAYRSDDGGLTWHQSARAGGQPLTGGVFTGTGDGWVVSYALPCVFQTQDAGSSWQAQVTQPSARC